MLFVSEDIFFSSGNEKDVSFSRYLLHTKAIGGRHASAVKEANLGAMWAIYFDELPHDIAKYWLLRTCRIQRYYNGYAWKGKNRVRYTS